MPQPTRIVRPYGTWESPVTPARLAQGIRLSDVQWDSDGSTLVWLEGRSAQGVLVAAGRDGEAPRDLAAGFSVRARVGYGGGDFTVAHGTAYFVADGRLWRQPLRGGPVVPVTPAFGQPAAPAVSPDGQWILYVHSYERQDCLAVTHAGGDGWPQRLVWGDDFYMQPRWHPDGRRIAFIAWNHPQMPWDGTELRLATLDVGGGRPPAVSGVRTLAGGSGVSIFQPEFSPDGRYLAYVSDESGWPNLHLYDLETGTHRALVTEAADHGRPAWVQGLRTHGFSPDGRYIYYIRSSRGFSSLWRYDLSESRAEPVAPAPDEYTVLSQIAVAPGTGEIALIASSPVAPPRVVVHRPGQGTRVLRRSAPEDIPPEALARPRAVSWRTAGGQEAHGLLYEPTNPRFESPGRPPAILRIHGGPTSQSLPGFSPDAQFFATRGYVVLEVNYRGSTGYGRAYMEALRGNWGVVDVEDALSAARFLGEAGIADPDRLVIMGASAGGYTVLRALTTRPGTFRAGISLYGVSNLFTLAAETHKFEERYLDSIVGPLPEAAHLYRERSPLFAADRITDPLALFQGADDQVVPRNQSDAIADSLRRRGVPHEYHVYEGEGHGWRRAETVEAFYRAAEAFLRQHVLYA